VTTWALAAFSMGLFAYSAVKILAAAFYAHQTTRIPVIVASCCVALNVILNVSTLVARTKLSILHPEWAGLLNGRVGVACLALATSIASWMNALTLFILLRRKLGALGGDRILKTAIKSSVGCLAMGFFCWAAMHMGIASRGPLAAHARIGQGIELAIAIAGGAGLYLCFAKLLRMEEWEPFWSQIRSRRAVPDDAE